MQYAQGERKQEINVNNILFYKSKYNSVLEKTVNILYA